MGIDEKSPKALLDSTERHFNFTANRALGHNTVEAIEAMLRGEVKVLIALGGNGRRGAGHRTHRPRPA